MQLQGIGTGRRASSSRSRAEWRVGVGPRLGVFHQSCVISATDTCPDTPAQAVCHSPACLSCTDKAEANTYPIATPEPLSTIFGYHRPTLVARNTGIGIQTLVWKHISIFHSERSKVVHGWRKALKPWTDHQWNAGEQSFRSQARYALACTAREIKEEKGTKPRGQSDQMKPIVFFVLPWSHPPPRQTKETRGVVSHHHSSRRDDPMIDPLVVPRP